MPLKDKTIIVVGASSGIGFETTKYLHKKGAHIIMVARDNKRLNDAAKKIRQNSDRLILITADLTTQKQ